ncbi:unnamed protein product [Echinostoma caproni]|uniref:SH2 domain-containing protein n=1 Tax=Echinostoma caproni TaxID=27848 RepID=A0A183AQ24_9TREM|nr:unnamed protein product [Echinostoma caproni]
MEAVAIHSFKPTEPDELGFEKGSILHIVEMEEDPNWYKARQNNREGMVPANYITLYPHPWYVPKCSRREAEVRLLEVDPQTKCDVQPDGAFILRQSENDLGQFSISVNVQASPNPPLPIQALLRPRYPVKLATFNVRTLRPLGQQINLAPILET